MPAGHSQGIACNAGDLLGLGEEGKKSEKACAMEREWVSLAAFGFCSRRLVGREKNTFIEYDVRRLRLADAAERN